jgi:hypothetical protein
MNARVIAALPVSVAIAMMAACGGGGSATAASDVSGTGSPAPAPVSAPVSGVFPEDAMPAWREGQAIGEWRSVSGSALSMAPPSVATAGNTGPQSKVIAWNSFVIDTRDSSVYSVANGGHHDYAGNEVDRIRLIDAAPKWIEQRAPTPPSQIVDSASYYADGRPTSRHTFYAAFMNERRGKAMVFGGSRWGDGWASAAVDGFDTAAGDWDPAHRYPDVPQDFITATSSAFVDDQASGDAYVFANYAVWRWSNATNSWVQLSSGTGVYGQFAASALDTRRNRILIAGGGNNEHHVYDIGSSTMQTVTFSGPNASAMTGDSGNGMVYDPALDAYLLRKPDAGGIVYRIDAQGFGVDTLPTTGGSSLPSAINGVWRRWLYVPQLKGIVYFPTYDGNFWFLRTS